MLNKIFAVMMVVGITIFIFGLLWIGLNIENSSIVLYFGYFFTMGVVIIMAAYKIVTSIFNSETIKTKHIHNELCPLFKKSKTIQCKECSIIAGSAGGNIHLSADTFFDRGWRVIDGKCYCYKCVDSV